VRRGRRYATKQLRFLRSRTTAAGW
jgi:hypothetical protein